MIEMNTIESSNIAAVGYDVETETLQVEFNNGSLYQYFNVPEHIYQGLFSADSVGTFLAQNIKGSYRYSRV